MKRLLLCAWVATQGALLCALPSVVSSGVDRLGIRDEPSLEGGVLAWLQRNEEVVALGRDAKPDTIDGRTSYWIKVIAISGDAGWVFGGHLNAAGLAVDRLAQQTDEGMQVSVTDYSGQLGDGELVLTTITAESFVATHGLPEVSVMFVRRPQSAARVVFVEPTGGTIFGVQGATEDWSRTLQGLDVRDVLGDGQKEIYMTITSSSVDGGESELHVYGASATSGAYVWLGTVPMDRGGAGDISGPQGETVAGPSFVTEGGKRVMKLVRTYFGRGPMDDGSPGRDELFTSEETAFEETYELIDGLLALTKEEALPVPDVP